MPQRPAPARPEDQLYRRGCRPSRESDQNFPDVPAGFPLSSAAGELVFHVFGVIAHFERRLVAERTPDGVAAVWKRGRHPGRPDIHQETMSAVGNPVNAGMPPGEAAKPLGIGRTSAYRIARERQEP